MHRRMRGKGLRYWESCAADIMDIQEKGLTTARVSAESLACKKVRGSFVLRSPGTRLSAAVEAGRNAGTVRMCCFCTEELAGSLHLGSRAMDNCRYIGSE